MWFENWPPKSSTHEWREQRFCLDIETRKERSRSIARDINEKYKIDFHSDVAELDAKGVMFYKDIPTKGMYDYFLSKPCYDFYGNHESFEIKNAPNHIKLGRHSIKDTLGCPGMADLITDEEIIKKASTYLGAPATLSLVLPMWSFPYKNKNPINMQLYHRDADDYKFVKFFVYLSDVDLGEGEQVYIEGTNNLKTLPKSMYEIKRYSQSEIDQHLSNQDKMTICGPTGTSWFADTYGIHRGTVPTTKNRLILQLQFTYSPVPIFNYKSYRFKRWQEQSDLVKYATRLYLTQ